MQQWQQTQREILVVQGLLLKIARISKILKQLLQIRNEKDGPLLIVPSIPTLIPIDHRITWIKFKTFLSSFWLV